MSLREILAPANILSLSRVPLAIWILFLLQMETLPATRAAVLILSLAGLTDLFDGILARRAERCTGQKNPYGIIIDPVADKLFAIVLIVGLIMRDAFPLWLAILVLGRDAVIMTAGAVLARKYKIDLPSNLPGKYYFVALAFLLAVYVARFEAGIAILEPLTLALWLVSSAYYIKIFVKITAKSESEKQGTIDTPAKKNKLADKLRAIALTMVLLALAVLFLQEDPLRLW